MRMLIAAGGHTVSSTEQKRKKKKEKINRIFIIRKQNYLFGNSYSNLDFLITTKNLGGLAAMQTVSHPPHATHLLSQLVQHAGADSGGVSSQDVLLRLLHQPLIAVAVSHTHTHNTSQSHSRRMMMTTGHF